MPDTVPAARYDLPWKAALTHAFRHFVAFFFPKLGPRIDWSKRPRFRDKELAGLGFGAAPDVMIADKLVEVRLHGGAWALIHVEIQAQRDAGLAQRMLDYNYRISKEYGRPVTSLVLLADEDPNWRPSAYCQVQLGEALHLSFAVAKLIDYAERSDVLLTAHNPIALVAKAHLRTQQVRHKLDELYAAKLQLTRELFLHRWRRKRIIELFKVINWMMVLPQSLQRRYWQAVLQLDREQKMELRNPLEQMFFEDGMEVGLKRGLERGREEGRKEGAVAVLERQLVCRFGPLSKTAQRKLAKASVSELEAWSEALLEAQSLKQVLG